MAPALLTMLLEAGLLQPEQARQAAERVRAQGGPVTTVLREMALLESETLARFLAFHLNLPYCDPCRLPEVPPVMLEFLPAARAVEYRALPLCLDQRGLHVALADPTERPLLQKLAGMMGYPLAVRVAPETDLLRTIQRLYGCSLPDREARLLEMDAVALPAAAGPLAEALLEEAEVVEDADAGAPACADPGTALAAAASRQEVAEILMEYLGRRFQRCALFLLRKGQAEGWQARRQGQPLPDFARFCMALDQSALLHSVGLEKTCFLGPVGAATQPAALLEALGAPEPDTILLLPLVLAGRVIGILWVEGPEPALRESCRELQYLLGKAACALEILVLRWKLLRA
jgi:hypothetical protein